MGGLVSAYDNDTMTTPFNKLIYGDPVHALQDAYTGQLGGLFYFMLALVPYAAMVIYQRSTNLASIWLIVVVASYNYLLEGVPNYITYILIALWVLQVFYRAASPINAR